MNLDTYLLFNSIHYVMKAEELLKDAGIIIDLVPVPREISSDCGMCIAFSEQDPQKVISLISRQGFPGEIQIYRQMAKHEYQRIEKERNNLTEQQ
ncbi:MAG: DUF3343 domain-containing protein [Deltaproteobacteria bacterium]|nr:DUF3343 domain-containing protein [Deltaproteobacteria bacterium]